MKSIQGPSTVKPTTKKDIGKGSIGNVGTAPATGKIRGFVETGKGK